MLTHHFSSSFQPLEVGMSILVDHSGKLFTRKKATIKDIISNREVGVVKLPRELFFSSTDPQMSYLFESWIGLGALST